MIRYDLRCAQGHDFDGWFRSSEGFDRLCAAGQVACTICGDTAVEKALMAPAVPARRGNVSTADAEAVPPPEPPRLDAPRSEIEAALARLRAHVEANSDYVGLKFADQARAMHDGEMPHRPIHGEARPDEARRLLEDGVPVAPLPFLPRQKAN